jgi:GPH family glycoside/pentoside/hexuronide:cation symporter
MPGDTPMSVSAAGSNEPAQGNTPLPLLLKIVYGSGDWGLASFGTLRSLLLGIFIADVVGLDLRLASVVLLVGVIWDAVNDPLVGMLSDRVRTRWGRRRPFLLWFAIPYGLSFLAMWIAPGWDSQAALLVHITIAYALSDTLFTLVSLPFYALTPELTPDYDERTSLTTFRMLFNLTASLTTAVVAPQIVRSAPTPQRGYTIVAILFGALATIPFLAIFFATAGRSTGDHDYADEPSLIESFKAGWENIPFRFATAINLLNWVTVDLVAFMLPFFLIYWLERGNQHAMLNLPIVGAMAIESVLFGLFLGTAVLALPLWWYLAKKLNKHTAYIIGMSIWLVAQLLFFTVQPGQRDYALLLAFLGGIGVSTAHVLPDSLFPDVIEWDELFTGQQRTGVFYGVRTFIRKVATAGALAIASQILGIFGYQQAPVGTEVFQQSPATLMAIRVLVGPVGALILGTAIVTAYFYPLTRERHARVRRLLAQRRALAAVQAERIGMP